jgi:hypothetical protein
MSSLKDAAVNVLLTYESGDVETVISHRSPSCIHQILPLSIGRPAMTNDELRQYLGALLPAFRNPRFTIKDTVVDEVERKVTVWASSTAETDIGPYTNEYAFFLKFDADGKVEWVGEFVDSALSLPFVLRLREHLSKA